MVAHQIAGKAARDGLFLSRFSPGDLPKIVALAALVSIVLGLGFARLLSRYSPRRVVPVAMIVSGLMHMAEFLLMDVDRGMVVSFVYLHIVGLGAILLSGFWSLASEVFDPREAKKRFGRIAGAGTAGGIAGGLMAERAVAWVGSDELLLLLAALHLTASVAAWVLGTESPVEKPREPEAGLATARRAFERAPFLVSLAVLVLLGTTSAALLDYMFKTGATMEFGKGPALTRYFALFYTGSQVLTFLVQTFLTPLALEKLGLGRTVMTLAITIVGGSLSALLAPAYGMIASVRALELVLRGSFFRSGYELFYTPIPAEEKRSVKTVIDVGCDRLGDALGAGALQLLILLGPLYSRVEILLVTIGLASASIWITRRMDRGYLKVLENGLISRAVELEINQVEDSTTMSAVLNTITVRKTPKEESEGKPGASDQAMRAVRVREDASMELMEELRCGDAERVKDALRGLRGWEPLIAPQIIRLLAWDDVTLEAREILSRAGDKVVGQLTDVLLDETQDFAVRRRVPRILARCGSQRAVDGLMAAMRDPRFEVRFQASRALDYLKQNLEELFFDQSKIFDVVARELSVTRPIWEGRRLLDSRDMTDSSYTFLDEVLKERANQGLEHVFSLLALTLPREPLKVAFRSLHNDDRRLRGLGFEYLSSTLPAPIYEKLTALLEDRATA
jgi:ATP:ADP antiporter, AAA family